MVYTERERQLERIFLLIDSDFRVDENFLQHALLAIDSQLRGETATTQIDPTTINNSDVRAVEQQITRLENQCRFIVSHLMYRLGGL